MKKALLLVAVLLLSTASVWAVSGNPTVNFENKSNFGHISAQGSNVSSNPGLIEMKSFDNAGNTVQYYLWVQSGKLCVASYPVVGAYASFPNASWSSGMSAACTVVGSQS